MEEASQVVGKGEPEIGEDIWKSDYASPFPSIQRVVTLELSPGVWSCLNGMVVETA